MSASLGVSSWGSQTPQRRIYQSPSRRKDTGSQRCGCCKRTEGSARSSQHSAQTQPVLWFRSGTYALKWVWCPAVQRPYVLPFLEDKPADACGGAGGMVLSNREWREEIWRSASQRSTTPPDSHTHTHTHTHTRPQFLMSLCRILWNRSVALQLSLLAG